MMVPLMTPPLMVPMQLPPPPSIAAQPPRETTSPLDLSKKLNLAKTKKDPDGSAAVEGDEKLCGGEPKVEVKREEEDEVDSKPCYKKSILKRYRGRLSDRVKSLIS